jgi:MFS family permease
LWRHPDFLKLWTGQTISQLGSVVTRTALPLVALLALGAGPLEMAGVVVARSSGVLLVGLVAGVWVDRLRRRPLLIWTDVIRAALLATIPVSYVLGLLRMEMLYLVAFLVACLGTLFDSAYRSYLPGLVGVGRVFEGNSKVATSEAIAEVGGPGFAGALVQVVSAPFAILVDAVSFVVSALSLAAIGAPEPPRPPASSRLTVVREVSEGIAVVRRHALLFPMAASSVTNHFFGSFYAAMYSLFVLNELRLSPFVLGVVISAGGFGSLIGSLFAARVSRRFGVGPAFVGCAAAGTLIGILTPLATGPAVIATLMLFIPQLIGDGLQTIEWISHDAVVQTVTPDRVLGRVNATLDVLSHGVAPFGALAAAVIAEAFGVRAAIAVGWLGMVAAVGWLALSPLPRMRTVAPASAATAAGGV